MGRRKSSMFGGAFSATAGVLLCLAIFAVGVPVVICMGCTTGIQTMTATTAEQRNAVRRHALAALKPHGITKFSKDISVTAYGPSRGVRGAALGDDGKTHQVNVRFSVATFDNTERWEVKEIVIDGEER